RNASSRVKSNSSRSGRCTARRFSPGGYSASGRRWRGRLYRCEFFLSSGRQFLEMAQKRDNLPCLIFAQGLVPRGHARPSNAMLDDIEALIIGHVGTFFEKLRDGRIKRMSELAVGIRRSAVAACAMIPVENGTRYNVLVGSLQRIFLISSVTIGGCIHCGHCKMRFRRRGLLVGRKIHVALLRIHIAADDDDKNCHDDSEEKTSHYRLPLEP